MEKQNKSIKEVLDSFEEYLYECTSGEVREDYDANANRIKEEAVKLRDDALNEKKIIYSEYDKKLEADENSELLLLLDEKLSFEIYIENEAKKQIQEKYNIELDDDSSSEFTLSDETVLKATDNLLQELQIASFTNDENGIKKKQVFDKYVESTWSVEEKNGKENLLSDIDKLKSDIDKLKDENEKTIKKLKDENDEIIEKLKKENDKIENSERRKFLILALISFAIAVVFIILGVTITAAYMVFNTIAGIGIIAGIVFLVLRAKVYELNDTMKGNREKIKQATDGINEKIKQVANENEEKINIDKKRIDEINERLDEINEIIQKKAKFKLAEKIKQLRLDMYEKEQSVIELSNKQFDALENELRACGDEFEAKLKAKEKELSSGMSDMYLSIFGKVKGMTFKFQHEFIEECRIRNVQSESEMLDVYKNLKREYDEEISRKNKEENERLANEEMIRQAQEKNRILQDQADQARRAADEQNRLLKQQADEQIRAADEQRRATDEQRRATDEQNRLLKQQADEQKRRQDEAKRIGYDFSLGMCPQCKNWIGCRMKDHLTGPCPSYVKK